jgi:signal peptide peptidase SppA
MKDYARIVTRINSSLWLMTEDAINNMVSILERHMFEDEEEIKRHAALFAESGNDDRGPEVINGVGLLNIEGPIFPKANLMTELSGATSLETFRSELRAFVSDPSVHSILVNFDSPGGVSDHVMEAAKDIRAARDIKPVITLANTMAASAALWLATQGNEFYITDSGLTGSLGAYTVHLDDSERDKQRGIKKTVIKAGKSKAAGEEPLNEDTRANLQASIDDLYDNFVNEVAIGRNLDADYVKANFGDGGIVTPREALRVKMVDGIKTFEQLLSEMSENGGVVGSPSAVAAAKALTRYGAVITWNDKNTRSMFEPDKEHGDVGTQGEPIPKEPQMEGDPAVTGGWRVPSDAQPTFPPAEHQPPPIQKGSKTLEGSAMNREQLVALADKLGIEVTDAMSDEELTAKITSEVDDVIVPLNEAAAQAESRRSLAKDYPDAYDELRELREERQETKARNFASRWERFEIKEGETTKKSTSGFAGRVLTSIEDIHLKLARKELHEDDLANLLNAIAETGPVDYSEKGSARAPFEDKPSPSSMTVKEVRQQFLDRVAEVMEEDGVDRKTATKLVGQRDPELAEAYKTGHLRR